MREDLLEVLVCPVCIGLPRDSERPDPKLALKEDGSGLKCMECKRVYPVRDDIPIMLVDEAAIEP
jgi:uncharacterized protein YbaR (Trm112 family)